MFNDRICAITSWNIDGLRSKISDDLFYSKVERYDIVGLVETWAVDESLCVEIISNGLQDFSYIFVPAVGECVVGRKSGGIILLFRKSLQNAIKTISTHSNAIWVKLSGAYFGWDKDVFLATVYVPPSNSKYYSDQFTALEQNIVKYSNMGIVKLMGDFNARLGNLQDYIIEDSDSHIALPPDYTSDSQTYRQSVHTKRNSHGKNLLSLCIATQLRILNGRTTGDTLGNFTYHDSKGSSAIDFFVCSESIQHMVWCMQIQNINYLSRHCQISRFLKCYKTPPVAKRQINLVQCPPSSKFITSNIGAYQSALLSPQSINSITEFMVRDIDATQTGIDQALEVLTRTIQQANTSVHPNQKCHPRRKRKHKPNRPYFDSNCRAARNVANELGKLLSKTPWQADLRQKYNFHKKQYKQLLKKQYRDFKQNLVDKLNNLDPTDSKELWNVLDNLEKLDTPKVTKTGLDHSDLFDHFKTLNQHHQTHPTDHLYAEELSTMEKQNTANNPAISSPTNFKEIKQILSSFKNNKAAGPDKISNELLKYGTNVLLSPITKLFNRILETEIVPNQWSHGYIVPIQKSGSKPTVENQRGLTILCCLGKAFTKLVNNRIVTFLDDKHAISEVQAGFRKNCRTTDNIFIIKSLIDKYVKNGKKRLYLGFIDFQKAFDTIWHPGLLYKLQLHGITGNIYNIIKNMYSKVTLQVKHEGQLTPPFSSNNGVRQGDNLSPTLFNIFINDLEFDASLSAPVKLHTKCITHLLYADDLLIISETTQGLQNSFDQLSEYCDRWHLQINPNKSQAMVIRNCPRAISHCFNVGQHTIDLCTKYRYLGIIISEGGNFDMAADELKAKASKALYKLKKSTSKCSFPVHLQLKLFDSLVKPILLYNCEIWGLHTKYINKEDDDYWLNLKKLDSSPFELFHHKYCKHILRLPPQTTNIVSKAELGRFPLILDILVSSIKYQHRLQTTTNTTLLDAYNYYIHAPATKHNWNTNLEKFKKAADVDSPHPDHSLSKSRLKQFATATKNKLESQYKRFFFSQINKSSTAGKLTLFQIIYKDYKLQTYLSLKNTKHKQTISKLRSSTHKLEIEIGRHANSVKREDRICKHCSMQAVENESHFLLHCPALANIRNPVLVDINYNPAMPEQDLLRQLLVNPTESVSQHIHAMYTFRLNLPTAPLPGQAGQPCT
jgi:exonuclease III